MNQYPKILLLFFIFFATAAQAQRKEVKKYIKKYETLAVKKMQEYNIPASIILGVSIVESAAGKSVICKSLNNFFGVKGKNTSSFKKMGYKSKYKEYDSDLASFEHFCQIVKNKKFYKKLKGSTDYMKWLNNMNTASYATAQQKWIDKIAVTISGYKLDKLDKEIAEPLASTQIRLQAKN
jgi:flagellum-specific peptidoglycan hydrolase FlgJ